MRRGSAPSLGLYVDVIGWVITTSRVVLSAGTLAGVMVQLQAASTALRWEYMGLGLVRGWS